MISKYLKPSKLLPAVLLATSVTFVTPAVALDESEKSEVREIIRDYLLKNPEIMLEVQQALEQKQQAAAKAQAQAALNESRETIFSSKHQGQIGNPDGDVKIVEFFDYNCGFCQRAMNDMNVLLESDPKLNFIMKELPILSAGSVDAARVSTAVYRLAPEKYGEFHNRLLGLDGQKDGDRAMQVAQEMGLDVAKISAESQKDDVVGAFQEANDLATRLGINGTPSYVIGDEVVFGALGVDVLREKISNMRKCGRTTCS